LLKNPITETYVEESDPVPLAMVRIRIRNKKNCLLHTSTLSAGSLDLWFVLVQFKRGVESGRFLPPELRAEIKQKVELTPQEKEILKKVINFRESGQ
jgi:hypothetical protein